MVSEKLKKLSPESKKYVVIGSAVYAIEVACIIVAQGLGASGTLAVGLSFWIGLCLSFILQKFVTFGDKRVHHKILIPQIVTYALLIVFNFSFTVLATKLLAPPIPAVIVRTGALGITTIWNFYLYKTRIFKTDDKLVY